MRGPKIVVIGAGSFFFGRPVIWNMVNSEVLKNGTLALVDTKPKVLETVMRLGKRAIEATGAPTTLIGSTDRREVLQDADFVVTTFSDRNAYFRGVDTEISKKYGIRMCSSDTIGPGGIFRALREIPHLMEITRDIEKLAPNAWVINFVNPTTVLGIALMRYTDVCSFAICDGLHEPHNRLRFLKTAGILSREATAIPSEIERKLDFQIAGVNHFTWLLRFNYNGKDYMPTWKEIIRERSAAELESIKSGEFHSDSNSRSKAKFNATYSLELFDIFGVYPDRTAHTKEYLPYFQGYGVTDVFPEPIEYFEATEREEKMAARWQETAEYADGTKPIQRFLDEGRGDHATDIIESMWGNFGKPFYVNTANRGAVTNMADDAFLELRSHLDMQGPVPLPVGPMPRGILGLQQQVLDTHELTAQAAVECDRDLLLQALVVDPIVNNIGDAKGVMDELLKAERDALPEKWFR